MEEEVLEKYKVEEAKKGAGKGRNHQKRRGYQSPSASLWCSRNYAPHRHLPFSSNRRPCSTIPSISFERLQLHPCKVLLCLAIDPVHHRVALASDSQPDPLAFSRSIKNHGLQFSLAHCWLRLWFSSCRRLSCHLPKRPHSHSSLTDSSLFLVPSLFPRQPSSM